MTRGHAGYGNVRKLFTVVFCFLLFLKTSLLRGLLEACRPVVQNCSNFIGFHPMFINFIWVSIGIIFSGLYVEKFVGAGTCWAVEVWRLLLRQYTWALLQEVEEVLVK